MPHEIESYVSRMKSWDQTGMEVYDLAMFREVVRLLKGSAGQAVLHQPGDRMRYQGLAMQRQDADASAIFCRRCRIYCTPVRTTSFR
jgi:hypothetical protein